MKYSLGLDLGIASLGWAVMKLDNENNFERIDDVGVRIFESLENPKDGKRLVEKRREQRGQRRIKRRRVQRISKFKNLFKQFFGVEYGCEEYDKLRNSVLANTDSLGVYNIKKKGLYSLLTKEELYLILLHYCKNRGFKSNRKVSDKTAIKSGEDDGKLLKGISKVEGYIAKEKCFATEYIISSYLNQPIENRRIHNGADNYSNTISRKMYLDEITAILDKQISYGLIDSNFKEKYINIWSKQLDFSDGPESGPYSGNQIEKMMSHCIYEKEEYRAPKGSFSAASFVLLSFLNNIEYKIENGVYQSLKPSTIKAVYEKAQVTSRLTYKSVFNIEKVSNPRIKGVDLSKKEYLEVLNKVKKGIAEEQANKSKDISNDTNKGKKSSIMNVDEPKPENIMIREMVQEKILNKTIPSLDVYIEQKSTFLSYKKEKKTKAEYDEFINDVDNYDIISEILLICKTDDRIIQKCKERGIQNEDIIKTVLQMKPITKTINLSNKACRNINKYLLNGAKYNEAVELAGYGSHSVIVESKKLGYIPPLDKIIAELDLSMTNSNVKHMLNEAIDIINALLRTYTSFETINIELARDLSRNFEDRKKIKRNQQENSENNERTKNEILLKYPEVFKSLYELKRDDIIKYKLFREQKGVCPYTYSEIGFEDKARIEETKLFGPDYEIDHILPFSLSFDDSYSNKILVFADKNQKKKNNIPFKYLKAEEFGRLKEWTKKFGISLEKQDKLLATEISESFIESNLNDTRYATKVIRTIIEKYLDINPTQIICCKGAMTSYLKSRWGLSNLTHSIDSKKMQKINDYRFIGDYFDEEDGNFFPIMENGNKTELDNKSDFIPKDKIRVNKDGVIIESEFEIGYRESYTKVAKNIHQLRECIFNLKAKNLYSFEDVYNYVYRKLVDKNNQTEYEFYSDFIVLLNLIRENIDDAINAKNRDNHLHHACDAVVIACCNRALIQRVTKYYQFNEEGRGKISLLEHSVGIHDKKMFPLPYVNFRNDVKNRIYQRDFSLLKEEIQKMGNYSDVLDDKSYMKRLTILMPSHPVSKKTSGEFHDETIFGFRYTDDSKTTGYYTKRIDVHKLDKCSDIDNIVDIDNGAKYLRLPLQKWLDKDDKTRKECFPVLPNGKKIKHVTLIEPGEYGSKVCLGLINKEDKPRGFANNSTVVRVDLYRNSENTLFFVPIYAYQIALDAKNIDYPAALLSNKKAIYSHHSDLEKNYTKITEIPKYSLVEIVLKSGERGICYTGGVSTGGWEIYSVLGDNSDIIKRYKLMGHHKSGQYQIGISSIAAVYKKEISVLGKIKHYEL